MNVWMTLIVIAVPIHARDVSFKKKIDAGALQAQLVAAGFAVDYIDCSGEICTIHLAAKERKDPLPVVSRYVYVDPMESRRKNFERLRELYSKLDQGQITQLEKDELLKKLAAHVLGK